LKQLKLFTGIVCGTLILLAAMCTQAKATAIDSLSTTLPQADTLNIAGTTSNDETVAAESDTIQSIMDVPIKAHSPSKATMYSAVLPGLGQIYNGSWYKVPIVYGGLTALALIARWNHKNYLNYKQAYFDLNDANPETRSYESIRNWNFDTSNSSGIKQGSDALKKAVTGSRRQRDMVIIYTAGFYLLNILDANVEAHFIDFDISEDLTFNLEPTILPSITGMPVAGLQLTFNF
jgi:hypothetical protein